MPAHGIRADIEFLALIVSAGILSFFMADRVISNVLFTALLSILFFMIGLHVKTGELRKSMHYRKEILIGGLAIYGLIPLLAFGISTFTPEGLGNAFIAIGISAAAIGTPVVFSNIGKGEGSLALVISSLSLFAGFLVIPLLLFGFDVNLPLQEFAVKNLVFLGAPLALGLVSQGYENFLIEDLKHHFSKLAVWILALVMIVQFRMIYSTQGASFITELGIGVVLLTGFTALSFLIGYGVSKAAGVMERKARTIGFVSCSKSLAVSLFIASQLGGEAVIFVSAYYFIRQGVAGLIAEYFNHGELKSLKAFLPSSLL